MILESELSAFHWGRVRLGSLKALGLCKRGWGEVRGVEGSAGICLHGEPSIPSAEFRMQDLFASTG